MQRSSSGLISEVVLFRPPPFGSQTKATHLRLLALLRFAPPPRAADNGSAGTADGSSAAAFAFLAALPARLHAQVAAEPLNTPVAKAHALVRLLLPPTSLLMGLRCHSLDSQRSMAAMLRSSSSQ